MAAGPVRRGRLGANASHLLGYEKRLLDGLAEAGGSPARLSALPNGFGRALDETRGALVREAVRQGWLRRLHHGRRSPKGEDLARQVRFFRRDLRRLKADGDQEFLTGVLLPYALHFGLMTDAQLPLARFARDWVKRSPTCLAGCRQNPKPRSSTTPLHRRRIRVIA